MAAIKGNSKERREKLLNFMKEAGAWRIQPAIIKELAKKYDVSERQIYMDIRNVIKKIPRPKVSETANKFLISWEYAIDRSIKMMRTADNEEAARGIKLFYEAVEKFTNFMHQYGFKEQVPDKQEMVGGITINIKEPNYENGNEPTTKRDSN